MIGQVLAAFVAIVVALAGKDIYHFIQGTLHPFFSPLRNVPGPPSDAIFMGSLRAIIAADPCELHVKWAKQYGPVVKYKMLLNRERLSIMDTRAVGHILAHPMDYEKPAPIRQALSTMLGNGLLSVEGETHKQQRRVMSPAFGLPQIRELTGIFLSKSIQLRDIWATKLQEKQLETNPDDSSSGKIEVLSWLNKMTLDVIGLAGFNHSFDALSPNESHHELNGAIRTLLKNSENPSTLDILHILIPATRVVKSKRDVEITEARAILDRVGKQFLAERKAAVLASGESKVQRKDVVGKDLLSLLVRDNMASDIPEDSRMTDEEVLAQVPTFLLAGHETTSTAVTWILYALSQNAKAQDKLREELRACDGDEPSMETLNGLPYLDCVVRETMRLFSPVSNTLRVAMKDDVIPTEKEWVDNKGVRRTGVPVSKGDSIFLPFLAFSKSEEIWGADANEWKPERWAKGVPPAAASIPGIWGNTFSFSGGARACIGYRFSVIEMKAIIYTLIRAFKFSMSVAPSDIKFKSTAVTRPHLKDKVNDGPQLPLWVSLVDSEAGYVHVA
ncbi:unnamed protein product [Peniophora sp. CBMAI 1063]|nr:unnamed protein product [Peniophora sp. CBMAI 1063]